LTLCSTRPFICLSLSIEMKGESELLR
jgi:hypothetical protein